MSEITLEQYQADIEALKADFEAKEKTYKENEEKLVNFKDKILSEKKEAELKAAKDANDHEEVMRIKGLDYQSSIESLERELLSVNSLNDSLIGENLDRAKDIATKEFTSYMISNDKFIVDAIGNRVKSRVGDDGKIVTEFLDFDGNVVSNDVKGALEWAAKDDMMRNYLAGSRASGGQAGGNNNHVQGRKNPKDMSSQERLEFKNQDPDGFKKAFNL